MSVVFAPRPARDISVTLTPDEVDSLYECLGDPAIWGEPDTTRIASVLEKLQRAAEATS